MRVYIDRTYCHLSCVLGQLRHLRPVPSGKSAAGSRDS